MRRIFEDKSASEEGVCRAHSTDEGTDIHPNGTSGNGRNGLFVSNQVLFSGPGDQIIIILHRPQYDIVGDVGTIDADELHSLGVLAGDVLVGRKVVDQTADDILRKLINISQMAIDGIIFRTAMILSSAWSWSRRRSPPIGLALTMISPCVTSFSVRTQISSGSPSPSISYRASA